MSIFGSGGLFGKLDPIGKGLTNIGGDPAGLYHDKPVNNSAMLAGMNEANRAAAIDNATRRINAFYGSPARQQQYQDLTDAVTQYYTDAINRQHDQAERGLKFSLARSGLTGGSVQADQNRRMSEDYTGALLDAARRGLNAGQQLRAQDEAAREALLGQVDSGLNATTAAQRTAELGHSNLFNAEQNAQVNNLGDIFGDVSAIEERRRQNQQYQQGRQAFLNALFSAGGGY